MQFDCKHTVATLLASNLLARQRRRARAAPGVMARRCSRRRPPTDRPGPRRRSRSASSCASACAVAPRRGRRCASRARRRAGCISSGRRCSSASARWSAAPARDAWIKGTVSWDVLRRPGHGLRARTGALVHRAAQHRPRHAALRVVLRRIGVAHARRRRVAPPLAAPRRPPASTASPSCRRRSTRRVAIARGRRRSALRAERDARRARARPRLSIDGDDVRPRATSARSVTSASTDST